MPRKRTQFKNYLLTFASPVPIAKALEVVALPPLLRDHD